MNTKTVLGGGILVALVAVAVFAPCIAPFDPNEQFDDGLNEFGEPMLPNSKFLLGTDSLGRDVLSRLLYGCRYSLAIGVSGVALAVSEGCIIALIAGFFGGRVDAILMRVTDIVRSMPSILLAIALSVILKPSLFNVPLIIGLVAWTHPARILRSQVLVIKQSLFIESARALGATDSRIMLRHIFPNVLHIVIALSVTFFGWAVLFDAGLNFLGLGAPPPTSSWGGMIAQARSYYRIAPTLLLYPGLAVFVTVLCFNLLGEGLEEHWRRRPEA